MIGLTIKDMNSGAKPYFSRKVSELQSGIDINDEARTITGTLNYVTDYDLFNNKEKDHGNFLALNFSAEEDVELKVALRENNGEYLIDPVVVSDGFCVFRVTNTEQKLVVIYTKGKDSGEVVYDLSGLTWKQS